MLEKDVAQAVTQAARDGTSEVWVGHVVMGIRWWVFMLDTLVSLMSRSYLVVVGNG